MKKEIIIALAAAVVSSGSIFAQKTSKFTAAKHNEYGLVYSLPTTHFNFEISAIKTVRTAGPYAKYAKKYLGIEDPILKDSQEWNIKEVKVTSYGVPDKENENLMQFKSGSSPFLILNEKGLPMSINIEQEIVEKPVEETAEAETSILEDGSYVNALPGEMLISESTAKRAEMAATMIYKIRESRTFLITGEADQMPPDGEAMKLVMQQLDEQEQALMAMFKGTEVSEYKTFNVDYTPKEEVTDDIFFRVSNAYGIVDKNDLSGDPVYLTLKITQKGELPINEKGETKKLPKGAVMYNIPGEAYVTLNYHGKDLCGVTLPVAQYGVQFGLDPDMFTHKKAPSYVIFNPETGAVKEIGNVNKEIK